MESPAPGVAAPGHSVHASQGGWAWPDPAASPALAAFPVVDAGHRAVRQLCQPQGHRRQKPSRPQVIPCVSRPGSPQGQQPLLGRRPSADSRQGAGAFSKASPSSAEQPQTAAHDLGGGGPQAFPVPMGPGGTASPPAVVPAAARGRSLAFSSALFMHAASGEPNTQRGGCTRPSTCQGPQGQAGWG